MPGSVEKYEKRVTFQSLHVIKNLEVREPSLVSFGDVLPGNSFESRAGELPASRGSCAFRRPLCLTSAELVVTGQAMWLAGVIPSRCPHRFAKNCMRRGGS